MTGFFTRVAPGGIDEFITFSLMHFITMFISLILLLLLIKYVGRLKNKQYEKYIRYGYVILLFSTNFTIWTYAFRYNMSWHHYLPIATCGWGVILGSIALLTKNEFLTKVVTFYGWGALLSIISPNILDGPLRFHFYDYLYRHILVVLIPFYMMKVHDVKIVKKDFWNFMWFTSILYFLGYFLSLTASNPEEVNMFFTIKPAISGTPLSFFYELGHIYYFIFWYFLAAFFAYIWGFIFYQKVLT